MYNPPFDYEDVYRNANINPVYRDVRYAEKLRLHGHEKAFSGPDNIYYNIIMTHDNTMGNEPTPAEYSVNKTQPFLSKASDYYASVIRFSIPMDTVPLLIMPIIPNQPNPNLTPLQIGIRNIQTNENFFTNLIYIPEDPDIPAPVQNIPGRQVIDPYYYTFSLQTLIDMFNTAILDVYTQYSVANPGSPIALQQSPIISYDAPTQLLSLIIGNAWNNSGVTTWVLYMNNESLQYLSAFNYGFIDNLINPTLDDNYFKVYYNGTNIFPVNAFPNPGGSYYLKITQNYASVGQWSSLRKLIITSDMMPIVAEQLPVGVGQSASDQYNSLPILSDFLPNIVFVGDSSQVAYYFPTSQYRLVDLISDFPLNKVSVKIFWQDKLGNLYPLTISIYQSVSIKIAFVKKTIYNNDI